MFATSKFGNWRQQQDIRKTILWHPVSEHFIDISASSLLKEEGLGLRRFSLSQTLFAGFGVGSQKLLPQGNHHSYSRPRQARSISNTHASIQTSFDCECKVGNSDGILEHPWLSRTLRGARLTRNSLGQNLSRS